MSIHRFTLELDVEPNRIAYDLRWSMGASCHDGGIVSAGEMTLNTALLEIGTLIQQVVESRKGGRAAPPSPDDAAPAPLLNVDLPAGAMPTDEYRVVCSDDRRGTWICFYGPKDDCDWYVAQWGREGVAAYAERRYSTFDPSNPVWADFWVREDC